MKFQKVIVCSLLSVLLVACGQSNSGKAGDNNTQGGGGGGTDVIVDPVTPYRELKEEEITRSCSATDVAIIAAFETLIKNANTLIDKSKGQKDDQAIDAGVDAVRSCDGLIALLGSIGACRWTKTTVVSSSIAFYDQYRVDQKCQKADSYLTRYGSRPAKDTQPPVVKPEPQPPVVVNPEPPVVTPPTGGTLRQCTDAEFSKLSEGLGQNDKALALITKQGDFNSWKYDSSTIASASLAAKACENLITYHDQQPCQKTITSNGTKTLRQYDNTTLRQRCEKARSYFYEFVQNKTTLNFKNADLYLDLAGFGTKFFERDYVNVTQGCRIDNTSGKDIDYSQQGVALIKSSRGFDAKMMVLETSEGLLVQCYGLNIGAAFSKREIVRLLKEAGTNMPLIYRLK